ncbi:hypothetical protein H072_7315 [Dactylellina haptotyla CBS 200.50]|uniref:Uncharacterized protein n=1 Tax=Dactylellina haptotyla (strain CBS 200.50) TaxID=1284197 RepID=S8BI20_DACHA|nr:hypothetical protein H072_7315 [Dactylellina haptotyla CBS 200.50]
MSKPMVKQRPSLSSITRLDAPVIVKRPSSPDISLEDETEENYYKDFDINFPESEDTEAAIEAESNLKIMGTTTKEQMDVEPPVQGETKEEEISRQERNFLRFHGDMESDGGISLDSQYTTLQWKENWRSFKFVYLQDNDNIGR